MIYFFNTNGDLLNSVTENVYQGSNNANTIYFVAPFPPDNKVTVNYRLPDGTITGTTLLTSMGTLEQAPLEDGSVFSVWSTTINSVVTAMAGYVTAQFDSVSATQTVATMNVTFPIIKGVAPVKPLDVSTEVTLQEILAILLQFEGQTLFNLVDGSGSGSIQQKGFSIPDGTGGTEEYTDEEVSQAYGPNSVAFNRAKTYQMSSFAVSSGEAGKTEEEFNAWFWDDENNVALHNGQGKDENGNILDDYGRTYARSFSFAVNLAEGGKAKGRGSVTSGLNTEALGENSQAHGKNSKALNKVAVAMGNGNYSIGNTAFTIGQVNKNWANGSFVFGNGNIAGQEIYEENGEPAIQGDSASQYSIVGGLRNKHRGQQCITIGEENTVESSVVGSTKATEVVGVKNAVTDSVGSAIFGNRNNVTNSNYSFVSGENNIVKSNFSAVFGSDNEINLSFVGSGWSFIAGSKNYTQSSLTFLLGTGLYSENYNETIVGNYNNDNDYSLFSVGNGTSNEDRRNAFEVKRTGGFNAYGDSSVVGSLTVSEDPTEDNEVTPKKYVDNKFNGANKAVSFTNYSAMITSLNALDNTAYSVGQNIMIVTLDVPDLWVSEIVEENVTYNYVSDTDFTTLLKTQGYVQVGYYKLSALETQKVDLTDYATVEALDTKLDKVTTTTQFRQVYTKDKDGSLIMYNVGHYNRPNFIVQYATASAGSVGATDEGGTFAVAMPQQPYQAVPKKYVDDSTKLYQHRIDISSNTDMFNVIIKFISKQATAYTSISDLYNRSAKLPTIATMNDAGNIKGFGNIQLLTNTITGSPLSTGGQITTLTEDMTFYDTVSEIN